MATHPYWPRSLQLPGWTPLARPAWQCSCAVAVGAAVLAALGWALGGARGGVSRSPAHRLTLAWFLLCAGIHGVLEGYYSLWHRELPGAGGLLADVWKEYSKADSRYIMSDDFVVVMETVTAWAWGPLSFLTFVALLRRHPARYVLQLLVSLGQLYGDVLYFATEARAGWGHSDPRPLYFWVYFVGLNGLWVVVPGVLLAQAASRLASAQRSLDRAHPKAH
ncbi:3-beta-hydroxysteroid-Delta(8),Delta(7)-isomerase [Cuculus canorus]|uniref:3-beta-hydroxysteroid-Delta(8), Delta(7)-isomerase n=1 Tax=Cuculus canorus TaxID=55661 RepID=UPI0023AABE11|nr:3-beta-hydroxysteroid-Delta(8),Delta(7)-isomerase [Cuculus canorus]